MKRYIQKEIYQIRIDRYIGLVVIVMSIGLLRLFYGSLLIGRTDVHNEIFVANLTIKNLGWFPGATENTYNSIFSVTVLPFLVFSTYNLTPLLYYSFLDPILYAFFVIITYKTVCDILITKKSEQTKQRSEIIIFIFILIVGLIRTGTHQMFSNNRSLIALSLFAILILRTYPNIINKSNKEIYEIYKSELLYQLIIWIALIISHWGTAIVGFIYLTCYYTIFLIRISKENRKVMVSVLITLIAVISFGILWYYRAPIIRVLVARIFENISDFFRNPSFKNLIAGNELLQNLLFLNKPIDIVQFIDSILSLVSITLPFLSFTIIFFKYRKREESVLFPKNEFRILLISTISFYIINIIFFITPGIQNLYGANRVYFQGMFFFAYICSHGFTSIDRNFIKIRKRKIIRFNSIKIYTFILILVFVVHQGVLGKFVSQTTSSKEDWRGSLLFDTNTIEFSRWYISDSDLIIYEWIKTNRINDHIYSEFTRLYQVYTYTGINFTTELLYSSDIRKILNELSIDRLPLGALVYIPHSSVICSRLYFSDNISDYILTNDLTQILLGLGLTQVYQNGGLVFQKL